MREKLILKNYGYGPCCVLHSARSTALSICWSHECRADSRWPLASRACTGQQTSCVRAQDIAEPSEKRNWLTGRKQHNGGSQSACEGRFGCPYDASEESAGLVLVSDSCMSKSGIGSRSDASLTFWAGLAICSLPFCTMLHRKDGEAMPRKMFLLRRTNPWETAHATMNILMCSTSMDEYAQ